MTRQELYYHIRQIDEPAYQWLVLEFVEQGLDNLYFTERSIRQ